MKIYLLALALPVMCWAEQDPSPYAGEQTRPIKALSSEQVEAYLQGSGMGFAKAAELNHYPGPRHVLELAKSLGLSATQIEEARAVESRMKEEAQVLGARLVDMERLLDQEFASGRIKADSLALRVMQIAMLDGQIRLTHLAAHLQMKELLSEEQIARYDALRGYQDDQAGKAHSGHEH